MEDFTLSPFLFRQQGKRKGRNEKIKGIREKASQRLEYVWLFE
jgi:hypothetical protein